MAKYQISAEVIGSNYTYISPISTSSISSMDGNKQLNILPCSKGQFFYTAMPVIELIFFN
jgi:hypothetical protein